MAVPMLNYATMPVVQPPSEMQGFSNALLQAGALRQDRLKAEQARADQLQQTQFNQNIATQQLGLQQKADARAEQAQQWQGQRQEMDMARLQAEAMQREKQQALQQVLSTPEIQAQFKDLQAKGDELGQLDLLSGLLQQTGNATAENLMEMGDKRMGILLKKSALETDELQQAKYRMDMAHTQLQMTTERMKQAAPMGGLDPKTAGQVADNIQAQIAQANGNLQKAKANIFTLGKVISATPTIEGLRSVQATLDADSPEFAKVQKIMALAANKPTPEAQSRAIADELAQLNSLRAEQEKDISYLETQAMPALTAQLSAAQQAMAGGDPLFAAVPLVQPQQQMGAPGMQQPQQAPGMLDAAIDLFGRWSAKGNIASQRERRGETPSSATFKAKGDAMNLPTSDEVKPDNPSGRPSKSTVLPPPKPFLETYTRIKPDSWLAGLMRAPIDAKPAATATPTAPLGMYEGFGLASGRAR
jgi:hypothetical protein